MKRVMNNSVMQGRIRLNTPFTPTAYWGTQVNMISP